MMTNDAVPSVSVIMPCYNQGIYLDEAVDSILAQTYQGFEIIVINDGSTDAETIQILKDYKKPGVAVIHTDNRGPAAARNTGIQYARGRYILPLDADDRIGTTYLEKAISILDQNPAIGIVYCHAEFFGAKTGTFDLPDFNFPGILLGNMIFNSSVYRKADWEMVGGYKDNFHGWEDYDFWLSLLGLGREVFRIPEVLYFYRQIEQSRSNSMTTCHWIEDYTRLFENHPELYTPNMHVVFEHIVNLRDDVHRTHARLYNTQKEVERLKEQIASMEQSKFWQLRTKWLELKRILGFRVDD
jgi:glycosyltransferase involved in cell wall biosynthesis